MANDNALKTTVINQYFNVLIFVYDITHKIRYTNKVDILHPRRPVLCEVSVKLSTMDEGAFLKPRFREGRLFKGEM